MINKKLDKAEEVLELYAQLKQDAKINDFLDIFSYFKSKNNNIPIILEKLLCLLHFYYEIKDIDEKKNFRNF